MSDDRKRNARTQGKFSDPKESRSGRRDKHSEKKSSPNQNSEKNDRNMKGHTSKSKSAEGVNLEYQENSKYTFEALSDKITQKEIREQGELVLSETQNGLSRIIYEPAFLSKAEAEELFVMVRSTTEWHDKDIVIRGQNFPQPRLVSWYGPFNYTYSGATFQRSQMPSFINKIKLRIEHLLESYGLRVNLNSVLLNMYRNEKDSVAWHSDDELSMGVEPTIASVSLGETRTFLIRPKPHVKDLYPDEYRLNLVSGSLLIMDGCMQKDYQHKVPKDYHNREPRINLTFRTVFETDKIPTEVPYLLKDFAESDISSKASQPKPIYDADSFPPLNPSSNSTSNISKTNSWSKNIIPHKKDSVEGNSKIASESAINSIENESNPVEFSTSEMSAPTKLVDNTDTDDTVKSPAEEETSVPEDSSSSNSERNAAGNKHTFNVNAPDFVPTTPLLDPKYEIFNGFGLKELSDYYYRNSFLAPEFFFALIKELQHIRNKEYFGPRDWAELDVYIDLSEKDPNVESQKVIADRIFSMIHYATKSFKRNMSQRTSRGRSYRGGFHR